MEDSSDTVPVEIESNPAERRTNNAAVNLLFRGSEWQYDLGPIDSAHREFDPIVS
jgi:hypothetical protein